MAHNNVEIEIQIKVQNTNNLLKFLKKNAKFISASKQIDTYFTPKHRNFTEPRPIKEWLRVRKSGSKHFITYKNWHFNKGKSSYCDEYETVVENASQIKNIFKALDLRPIVVVNKTRKSWKYKHYEVSLDTVKNLGKFVEVEYVGRSSEDPEKITKQMLEFIKKRKVGKVYRNFVGYPFQILFPKEVKFEEQ